MRVLNKRMHGRGMRDFNDLDGQTKRPVVTVSQTLAQRMFPNQDAIHRHVYWTDPVLQFRPRE